MTQNALLTVAIPTYNRSETLEKILLQLAEEKGELFQILVSDDSSSDGTETMVRRYQERLPRLIYHKNEVNLGYSGNVNKIYELSQTPYVWFLCDDDTVLPGAIQKIIDAIRKYQPVVAVFNYSWVDPYGRKSLAVAERDVVHTNLSRLDDYQPLMRITFLSTLVVKKNEAVKNIGKTVYQDNVFFQLTLSLLLLSKEFKYCEIGGPIVHRNVGYKYGEFFKFYLVDVLKAVFSVEHAFDNKKFIQRMVRELPNGLRLYVSQKLGLFSYRQEPTPDTLDKIRLYYGPYKYFIYAFKYIKWGAPTVLLKAIYIVQLISIHGLKKGLAVYRQNINRAFTDQRKTEFMNYK